MSYSIKIKGLESLKKNFKTAPKMITKELAGAIKTSIHIIRPIMVTEEPHDTGELRKNTYARQKGLTGFIGPDLEKTLYAIYVNYGTYKMNANPFMQRTANKMEPIVERIFNKTITKIVNRLAK